MSSEKELATAPPAYSPHESLPPPSYDAATGTEQASSLYAPPTASYYNNPQYQQPPAQTAAPAPKPYYEAPQDNNTTTSQPYHETPQVPTPTPTPAPTPTTTTTTTTHTISSPTHLTPLATTTTTATPAKKTVGSEVWNVPVLFNGVTALLIAIATFIMISNIEEGLCDGYETKILLLYGPAAVCMAYAVNSLVFLIFAGIKNCASCCSHPRLAARWYIASNVIFSILNFVFCSIGLASLFGVDDCYSSTSVKITLTVLFSVLLTISVISLGVVAFFHKDETDSRTYNLWLLQLLILVGCVFALIFIVCILGASNSRRR